MELCAEIVVSRCGFETRIPADPPHYCTGSTVAMPTTAVSCSGGQQWQGMFWIHCGYHSRGDCVYTGTML